MQPMRKAYQEATIQSGIWQVGESQDLDGAFLGLGNQWICRVSYVCIEQIILNKQCITVPSLSSTTGWTSHILLAYIIPWISKKPALCYIHSMHHACVPCQLRPIWISEAVLCCWVCFCDCSIETVIVEVESRSQTPRLRSKHRCRPCTQPQCIDDLLPHAQLQQCSY